MYTLYMHISPSHKVYIGVTSRDPHDRWRNGRGYSENDYLSKAIKKYGWENFDHYILCEGLTKDEAESLEKMMIQICRATNRKHGYNIENGGFLRGSLSEETRKKISQSLIGDKNPRFGKKFPYQMRRSRSGKCMSALIEESERRRKSHLGQVPKNRVKVQQISQNGNPIKIYQSLSEAGKGTGVDVANISRAIKKGRLAGGYYWKKVE